MSEKRSYAELKKDYEAGKLPAPEPPKLPVKRYTPRKATGVSVEEFYAAQDEAKKEYEENGNIGVYANKTGYSCFILARVEPMPTYQEFREMLEDDINALVEKCKQLNPRHFDLVISEGDQKKSES